jgi:hypothetical protein
MDITIITITIMIIPITITRESVGKLIIFGMFTKLNT